MTGAARIFITQIYKMLSWWQIIAEIELRFFVNICGIQHTPEYIRSAQRMKCFASKNKIKG